MAGAGYKLFATNDVLTAGDLNTYLQEQSVMVFATTAARDSALTSVLAEGMVCYVEDNGSSVAEFQVYDGAAWRVVWTEGGPSDHDFLPLSGGTLTGDLDVDGTLRANGNFTVPNGAVRLEYLVSGEEGTESSEQPNIHVNSNGWTFKSTWKGLPLTGGTLTGDLTVNGQIQASNGTAANPSITFKNSPDTGFFRNSPGKIHMSAGGVHVQDVSSTLTTINTDLQVDGQADFKNLMVGGNLVAEGGVKLNKVVSGQETTTLRPNLYVNSNGWLFETTWTPSRMAFAPSELTRDDVLERAETATLPPEPETDDDGNQTNTAEIEAHDTVQLFDVVTALLLKVKELSAEIKELKGN